MILLVFVHCLDCGRNCGSFTGSAVMVLYKKTCCWCKHIIQMSIALVEVEDENWITVLFCFFLFCWSTENDNHLVIAPERPVLAIGTNFTATCMIIDTTEVTADDLYWKLSETTVSKEHYTKINRSALSVTIPVTGEKHEWLFCCCKKVSPSVILNDGKFIYGIILTKGCKFLLSESVVF